MKPIWYLKNVYCFYQQALHGLASVLSSLQDPMFWASWNTAKQMLRFFHLILFSLVSMHLLKGEPSFQN